jgi:hypothetical protein
MAREVEIANDFRTKKRDDVGKNGKLEAGNDFFRDSSAAENVAALEDQNFLTRAREIGGIHKAVVAAADDNDVVTFCHEDFLRLLCRLRPMSASRSILQVCAESHKNEAGIAESMDGGAIQLRVATTAVRLTLTCFLGCHTPIVVGGLATRHGQ